MAPGRGGAVTTAMVYLSYLLCLALVSPALGLSVFVLALKSIQGCTGWPLTFVILAFFGAGIAEPIRYGWRIVALIAVMGFLLCAGVIPALRTHAFHGLALLATMCAAFCLFEASKVDRYNVINALIVLTPSFLGIVACLWFAIKFKT